MDPASAGRPLALGRIIIGSALTCAPRLTGRQWLGAIADQPGTAVVIRSLGARDLAIGAGLLRALDTGSPTRPWLLASTASDAADVVGTLLAWKHLPRRGRLLTATTAAIATLVGALAANARPAAR